MHHKHVKNYRTYIGWKQIKVDGYPDYSFLDKLAKIDQNKQ